MRCCEAFQLKLEIRMEYYRDIQYFVGVITYMAEKYYIMAPLTADR